MISLVSNFSYGIPEILDIREALVDRREADVGDLVELAQLLHHHLAQPARVDLALAQGEHLLLDARDGGVHELHADRALVQRPRRRIESPSSLTRESITWVSSALQKGHFMPVGARSRRWPTSSDRTRGTSRRARSPRRPRASPPGHR